MACSIQQATNLDVEQLIPLFDGYRQFYGTSSDLTLARQFLVDRMTRNESVVLLARGDDGASLGFAQLFPSFLRCEPLLSMCSTTCLSCRRRGARARVRC